MDGLFEKLRDAVIGTPVKVTRYEHSWRFLFESRCWIMVECPWRIVSEDSIAFASADDGHQFGLAAPVDGEATARKIIGSSGVADVTLDRSTADIVIAFENGSRIDVFNNSSGYEGWQAGLNTARCEAELIGLGGGSVAEIGHQGGS